MYRNCSDKRVIQTTERLFESIVELMKQKSFDKIGIKEICDQAGIGRATFYRNFDNVDDILRFKLDQTFCLIIEMVGQREFEFKNVDDEATTFYSFWSHHSQILEALYNANRWSIFDECFLTASYLKIQQMSEAYDLNDTQMSYLRATLLANTSAALHTWLSRGKKETTQELAQHAKLAYEMYQFRCDSQQ